MYVIKMLEVYLEIIAKKKNNINIIANMYFVFLNERSRMNFARNTQCFHSRTT